MIGGKDCWGRGYGTDAIRALLRFAFREMNLNRVWLTTGENNPRALACYRKCGFREEGRLRQDRYLEGRYWDTILMGILRRSSRPDGAASLPGYSSTAGLTTVGQCSNLLMKSQGQRWHTEFWRMGGGQSCSAESLLGTGDPPVWGESRQ